MKAYMEQIKKYINRSAAREDEPVVDILYQNYLENNLRDEAAIRQEFGTLDAVLSRFTLAEYDRVWNAVCRLCDEHERRGFFSGLQIGTALMLELYENNQQKDTCF